MTTPGQTPHPVGNTPSPRPEAGKPASPGSLNPRSAARWLLVLLPMGYLWFRLVDNLRVEWATNPQYSFGWVVPVLCLGLLIRRLHTYRLTGSTSTPASASPVTGAGPFPWLPVALFAVCALMYLPTRLIEEATPEWRPIQWSLAIIAIGLTLCMVRLNRGGGVLREVAFPICFLLVAVPWPTLIEAPIIQGLSRVNARLVVEVVGCFGVPAMRHGNVIEIGTGIVGIDEACSGIRSFQSSLMISLFFGEFYRFGLLRRLLLVPSAFLLAMLFNVIRTSFLTMVAARKGIDAISEYHDGAGMTILMACTLVLWGMAYLMSRRSGTGVVEAAGSTAPATVGRKVALPRLGMALIVWLMFVEIGVQLWYTSREAHAPPAVNWSVVFPTNNPTFETVPMNDKTRALLRFDDASQGQWREEDGTFWRAFYFSWRPGRVAGYLAKRHTPDICMPALGEQQVAASELTLMDVHGIQLPMRRYTFRTSSGQLQVFQCRWEAGVPPQSYVQAESARFNLIRGVWAGRGKNGQKVLEIAITGLNDPDQAREALARELEKLIRIDNSPPAPGAAGKQAL